MTLLAFLLALGVLITVHEWGHYRVAVACGVKVVSFSIGFGRPLIRWKSRKPHVGQDTDFLISLIPLGGYVKMLDASDPEVDPQDLPMTFNRQPLWARATIVSAGPLANLLFAIFLYAGAFWIGQYETRAILAMPEMGSIAEDAGLKSGDAVLRVGLTSDDLREVRSLEQLRFWVHQHSEMPFWFEVQSQEQSGTHLLNLPAPKDDLRIANGGNAWTARGFSAPWGRAVLSNVQVGKAADAAGLIRNDEIKKINGEPVIDASHLRTIVRESGRDRSPDPQIWEIYRTGQGDLLVDVVAERVPEGDQYIGRIGAQLGEPPARVWVQYGLLDGVSEALFQTAHVASQTVVMLGRLVTGEASFDNLSGPVAMADFAGRSASLGFAAYLSYLALVSVSLGVFNLLPLPVLDGGHLLYYLYEACTGRAPSQKWLNHLQRGGLTLLVGLMVFSLFNDIFRLGWLF